MYSDTRAFVAERWAEMAKSVIQELAAAGSCYFPSMICIFMHKCCVCRRTTNAKSMEETDQIYMFGTAIQWANGHCDI